MLLNRHHPHRQHHHQMNDQYPEEAYLGGGYPTHDRGQQPYFEGREVASGPSTGFGGQMPATGFGVPHDNGYGRQPHTGFQVQRPGEYFGGQPPMPYGQEHRRGPWGVPRPFQAGQAPPFQQPFQPALPPHSREFRFPEHTRPLQPHPWEGSTDLGAFQESGNGINPLGNPQEATEAHFPSSGNSGNQPQPGQRERNPINPQQPSSGWQPNEPLQPRPQTNGPDSQLPTFGQPLQSGQTVTDTTGFQQPAMGQQSGGAIQLRPSESAEQGGWQLNEPLQPRPQANGQDSQLPTFGTADSTLQPRPQQATSRNPEEPKFKFPSAGNSENPQQLHPSHTVTDSTGFQQSAIGQQSGGAIQPRPSESADHGWQSGNPAQPNLDTSTNAEKNQPNQQPIQPLPQSFGEAGYQKPHEEQGSAMTLQPLPTDSTIEDNIASIFNTHSYLSSNLTEIGKAQRSQDPDSIGQRNLFETTPQCKEGMELRGGRCRSKA